MPKKTLRFVRKYAGPLTEGRRWDRGEAVVVRSKTTAPEKKALHRWQVEALQKAGHVTPDEPADDTKT